MALSSNSLIHLTSKKESLIGILRDEFRIFYCYETIDTSQGKITAGFPMVSFCDIPLSEIKNHINNYGHYGIGMKKEWAKKEGLNPVLYLDKASTLSGEMRETTRQLLTGNILTSRDLWEPLVDVLRFLKNYENDLKRSNNTIYNYRFSDEREWRYSPPFKSNEYPLFVTGEPQEIEQKKEEANKKVEHLRLSFAPNDINYIIIDKEEEISEFINILRDAKGKNYSMQEVERLQTRIITTEQILSDF